VGSDSLNYILPSLRLAPVQCTSWGIQDSSGIANLDYYLSSRWLEPDGAAAHYSERLLLLDTLLKPGREQPLPPATRSRADFGLNESDHLYLCPQHLAKLHPDFDPLLADLLRRDPQGKLLLVEWPSAYDAQALLDRFANHFPDCLEQVVMLPHQKSHDYIQLLHLADLLLDPPHFGGVNTSYDAFACGKVVVTLPGRFQRGRFTYGCYRKMGIDEAVASDGEDYVARALRLAVDKEGRAEVERAIGERFASICEPQALADGWADALEECVINGVRLD